MLFKWESSINPDFLHTEKNPKFSSSFVFELFSKVLLHFWQSSSRMKSLYAIFHVALQFVSFVRFSFQTTAARRNVAFSRTIAAEKRGVEKEETGAGGEIESQITAGLEQDYYYQGKAKEDVP